MSLEEDWIQRVERQMKKCSLVEEEGDSELDEFIRVVYIFLCWWCILKLSRLGIDPSWYFYYSIPSLNKERKAVEAVHGVHEEQPELLQVKRTSKSKTKICS